MAAPLIRLGDKTSHDGTVVEASAFSDSGGKGIARVGDRVNCPRHSNVTIATGDPTMLVDGRAVARHGDKTSCGATLIAGQQNSVDMV
ncbi:PAAR domain-containing protein [Massilia forsythiae]|uniref:PAAR domain-containing protein n=1 Tax=Massilia forsythiae TaxID=2728020 RepID=A0A7Z2VZL4_9BURK|nr:PAAR domain-containing protein [Massilia forsythiae]QJE02039.1 PAAR domain-containing protein [Massilia forsythiae]